MSYYRFFSLVITFVVCNLFGGRDAFAASVQSFEFQTESGQISRLAVTHENIVLVLDNEGALKEIYLLDSKEEAEDFSFSRPIDPKLEKIALSCHASKANKTVLYGKGIGDASVLKYRRTAYDKTNGCFNAIASVRDIPLDYYKETPFNRKANVVGRLKAFGDIKFQYYIGTSAAYLGKIQKIDTLRFMYESWSSYGEKAGYIGKYLSIGDLSFDYAEYSSVNKTNNVVGKILKIGKLKFKYLSKFNVPHPPKSMMGHFSMTEGTDKRFKVFMPVAEE